MKIMDRVALLVGAAALAVPNSEITAMVGPFVGGWIIGMVIVDVIEERRRAKQAEALEAMSAAAQSMTGALKKLTAEIDNKKEDQ